MGPGRVLLPGSRGGIEGEDMIRLKYLGGDTPIYQNAYATLAIGEAADFPDDVALAMLEASPNRFERVAERSVDATANDRMRKTAPRKRAKK